MRNNKFKNEIKEVITICFSEPRKYSIRKTDKNVILDLTYLMIESIEEYSHMTSLPIIQILTKKKKELLCSKEKLRIFYLQLDDYIINKRHNYKQISSDKIVQFMYWCIVLIPSLFIQNYIGGTKNSPEILFKKYKEIIFEAVNYAENAANYSQELANLASNYLLEKLLENKEFFYTN